MLLVWVLVYLLIGDLVRNLVERWIFDQWPLKHIERCTISWFMGAIWPLTPLFVIIHMIFIYKNKEGT